MEKSFTARHFNIQAAEISWQIWITC